MSDERDDRPDGYLAPEHIRNIPPYPPGRPLSVLKKQLGLDRLSQLASNENTAGPPPAAVAAIEEAVGGLQLYPEGTGQLLRRELAERYGVDEDQVVLGNGSAELVQLLLQTFVTDHQRVVNSRLAFIQYRLSAWMVNAEVVDVATRGPSRRDDAVGLALASEGARMVFIANPNNPTGTYITRGELDEYFQRADPRALTVIDQAYQEYIDRPDYPDALDDLAAGRNVVMLGTFSKAYGLAGLRIGYGIGPAAVMRQIHGARLPFNTTSLGQIAARAALGDDDHIAATRERNDRERTFLEEQLTQRGLPFLPSIGNFLLIDLDRPAIEVAAECLDQGVEIRPLKGYGLPQSIRVTVGQRHENEHFLEALDRVRAAW